MGDAYFLEISVLSSTINTMSNFYKSNYVIAKKFNVTPTSVQRWIERTVKGELNLEIAESEGRWRVINNLHNQRILFELSQKAKEFDRSKERRVDYKVSSKLYDILTTEQTLLLARSLKDDLEIPMKYDYMGEVGVQKWHEFHVASQGSNYDAQDCYSYFLDEHLDFILSRFKDELAGIPKINVIDLGCGTADYTIGYIRELDKLGLLNSFAALDISKAMLEKVTQRFNQNDLKHITLHTQECDLDKSLPFDFLHSISRNEKNEVIPNLFLNFGGQISNNEPYEQIKMMGNIAHSMSKEDRFFIVNAFQKAGREVTYPSAQLDEFFGVHRWIVEMLGIKQSDYSIHFDYDENTMKRTAELELNKDINLYMEKYNTLVNLKKNQKITVWKHRRETYENIFQNTHNAGMELELISTDKNDNWICYLLKKI